MKLEDGDSPWCRFVSPSGLEIKSFLEEYSIPSESEVKVHFHGSLSSVIEVFSTFDAEKKKIVRSIGFEGVLNLAKFQTFDLYFCLWVMSKVDCSNSSIRMKGCEEIPIRNIDVGNILGIPWYGEEILVERIASHETVRTITEILRKADINANLTFSHLEKILKKKYSEKMNKEEIAAFKIAFVVFTMTNVMATGWNHKIIPLGLLKFLRNPDKIHLYNWGLLVRRYMVSWCHLVQQQLKTRESSITIGGCFLLPMVSYLDNVLLGSRTVIEYEFPRSAAYNSQNMMRMIASDTTLSCPKRDGRVFGISKLKEETNVCYGRWLVDRPVQNKKQTNKRKSEGSEHGDSIKKKKEIGIVAKLFLLAANKSMKRELIIKTGLHKQKNNHKTSKQKEAFPDGFLSKMNAFIEEIRVAEVTGSTNFDFFRELDQGYVVPDERNWIHHLKPYEINIKGSSLANQLLEGGRYCQNVYDAISREQVQREDIIFFGRQKRERHLIPPSFLEMYRFRDRKLGHEQLRIFFQGDHVKYNVIECIQINMPVCSRRMWSCYSWNLIDRTLTVLDPFLMKGSVSIIKMNHEDLVSEVNTALFSCLEVFFPAYIIERGEWRTIYRNDISEKCNWCDTGVYSMHYAVTFNTDNITDEINSDDDYVERCKSLWRILAMDGNDGEKPERFKELLNEET